MASENEQILRIRRDVASIILQGRLPDQKVLSEMSKLQISLCDKCTRFPLRLLIGEQLDARRSPKVFLHFPQCYKPFHEYWKICEILVSQA